MCPLQKEYGFLARAAYLTEIRFDCHNCSPHRKKNVTPQKWKPQWHYAEKRLSFECLNSRRNKECFGHERHDRTEHNENTILPILMNCKCDEDHDCIYECENIIVLNERDKEYHPDDRKRTRHN